jgi:hypothetical protein
MATASAKKNSTSISQIKSNSIRRKNSNSISRMSSNSISHSICKRISGINGNSMSLANNINRAYSLGHITSSYNSL